MFRGVSRHAELKDGLGKAGLKEIPPDLAAIMDGLVPKIHSETMQNIAKYRTIPNILGLGSIIPYKSYNHQPTSTNRGFEWF